MQAEMDSKSFGLCKYCIYSEEDKREMEQYIRWCNNNTKTNKHHTLGNECNKHTNYKKERKIIRQKVYKRSPWRLGKYVHAALHKKDTNKTQTDLYGDLV